MNVADETMTKLVIMDPPGKSGRAAKRDNPDRGVGGRSTGDFPGIVNGRIKCCRLRRIDQIHHPLADIVAGKKRIITGRKYIDNGIADSKNINSR
jgi:hypothetical protein